MRFLDGERGTIVLEVEIAMNCLNFLILWMLLNIASLEESGESPSNLSAHPFHPQFVTIPSRSTFSLAQGKVKASRQWVAMIYAETYPHFIHYAGHTDKALLPTFTLHPDMKNAISIGRFPINAADWLVQKMGFL